MDAATAITVDAAADLFSVLPDVRAEKAPGADQPPRGFFSPEFSFSETVSVSVLLFPAFPSLLFFLFFSYIPDLFHKRHSLQVPVFFLLFLFHPFSGGLLFFLPLIICFFPPSVIFSGLEHKIKRNKKTNAGMLPGRILI